jgi:prepilin-type N-terminal cleavage/methylation domain-containing protein
MKTHSLRRFGHLGKGVTGFTLLELMIVLFIAGLSLSVVILSVGRMHENAVFKEEVRKLHTALRYAREISLLKRVEVRFDIDEEESRYWIFKEGSVEKEHLLPQGFLITGETITFSPKGDSSGGFVNISDDKGREYRIEVDPVLGIPSIR